MKFRQSLADARAILPKAAEIDPRFQRRSGPSELGRTINFGPLEFPIVFVQDQVGRGSHRRSRGHPPRQEGERRGRQFCSAWQSFSIGGTGYVRRLGGHSASCVGPRVRGLSCGWRTDSLPDHPRSDLGDCALRSRTERCVGRRTRTPQALRSSALKSSQREGSPKPVRR